MPDEEPPRPRGRPPRAEPRCCRICFYVTAAEMARLQTYRAGLRGVSVAEVGRRALLAFLARRAPRPPG